MAVDFYPHNGVYLFIDFGPNAREVYLIKRKLKELEKASIHAQSFVIQLRNILSGRELTAVFAAHGSLRLELAGEDGEVNSLQIQLAAASNVFVLDSDKKILVSARSSDLDGQKPGDRVGSGQWAVGRKEGNLDSKQAPELHTADRQLHTADRTLSTECEAVHDVTAQTLSEKLDRERQRRDSESLFDELAKEAGKNLSREIAKRRRLVKNLENDLKNHGDAESWKRFGELIIANISSLRREGDSLWVTDYFDPEMREVRVPAGESLPPKELAESYFRKYAKARNGLIAIASRLKIVNAEIQEVENKQANLEAAIESRDLQKVAQFVQVKRRQPDLSKQKKKDDEFKGARKFLSADGYEILVGKKAKDNDHLTFRIAKSMDLWLHAADYPGSHVVIRNPTRKDIPVKTLIEAAQLAAFYSDAREKPKAAVNYTPKKFVNKPKRSAPGLVSLASFKTVLVVPQVPRS